MSSILFPQKLYTYDTASSALNIASGTLRRLVSRGVVQASRVGGRVVFRPEQLEAAIQPNARAGSRRGKRSRGK